MLSDTDTLNDTFADTEDETLDVNEFRGERVIV